MTHVRQPAIIARCASFRAEPSPSSSPTSRAPRSCCTSSVTATPTRSASTAARFVQRSPRTTGSRSTRRATRSSWRSRARDALAAAQEGQEALASGPIRVRMGVHTGEPIITDEGYVGLDVHRAARIAAVGHGGQVLVSQSTRELVGPDGLVELGEHRLKDLRAPERIYQLGDGEFPPLKSLNQSNLPVQPTPFVGREKELGEVFVLLHDPSTKLLTLTGAGARARPGSRSRRRPRASTAIRTGSGGSRCRRCGSRNASSRRSGRRSA